ncbi:MAG: pyridoxal kinase, partial [Pseudomonadota bacterium]|nr:pyridoxal kinase [Pseudomonadota bacterium]
MTVLSIQSSVSFGYVGNSIAIPTLQKLGHDCWYVHTVYFSNHPGHKEFSGEFTKPKTINEKIQKIR